MVKKNKIQIEIAAKNKTKRGVDSAEKRLKAFSSSLRSIAKNVTIAGGAMAAGLAVVVRQASTMGDELQKTSIRTGASVEMLSRLGHAAQISGADMGALRIGIRRLGANMRDARDGLLASLETFEELGVTVTDTEGNLRPMLDVFLDMSDSLKGLGNETLAAALAQRALGRSGDLLLPLLFEGRQGIMALADESDRLGNTWTRLEADQAAAFVDANTRVKASIRGITREIFIGLEPALSGLADSLSAVTPKLSAWIDQHPKAVAGVGKLTAAVVSGAGLTVALAVLASAAGIVVRGMESLKLAILGVRIAMLSATAASVGAFAGLIAALGSIIFLATKAREKLNQLDDGEKRRQARLVSQGTSGAGFGGLLGSLGASLIRRRAQGQANQFVGPQPGRGFGPERIFPQRAPRTTAPPPAAGGPGGEVQAPTTGGLGIAVPGGGQARLGPNGPVFGPVLEMTEQLGMTIGHTTTLTENLTAQFEDLGTTSQGVAGAMVNHLAGIGDAIGVTFANELAQGKLRLKSFGAAFGQVFQQIVAQIVAAIAKLVIFKALFGIFGGGPVGGLSLGKLLGFQRGGIVRGYQGGGIVTGGVPGRDSVLAAVAPGEAIIPKQLTD